MKIIELECGDFDTGWKFSPIKLDRLNLFVGASGAGKSKLLNWLFDIANKAANDTPHAMQGYWRVVYEHADRKFVWEYESKPHPQVAPNSITRELVKEILSDQRETILIERDSDRFVFNGAELPKLSSTASALHTLREDPAVTPAHAGFRRIMRRHFFGDELGLAGAFQEVPANTQEIFKKTKSLEKVWGQNLSLGVRLSLLKQSLPDTYKAIVETYKSIFPFIKSCDVVDLSQLSGPNIPIKMPGRIVPMFAIYETKSKKPIPYVDMSSGMQKVLLIVTDIAMLPGGAVYLIDEYENSLGINAINFLPTFLLEEQRDNQILITSHHPYLINAIDVKSWFVFHRAGTQVTIKPGTELEKKYGRSKQALFTQLLNDPFYAEGIE